MKAEFVSTVFVVFIFFSLVLRPDFTSLSKFTAFDLSILPKTAYAQDSSPTETPTPTLTLTPTPTPTPIVTITPTVIASSEAILNSPQQQVLGQTQNSLFSIPSGTQSQDNNIQLFSAFDKQIISKILIFLGIIFMFLCAIVIFYPKVDSYLKSKRNEQ